MSKKVVKKSSAKANVKKTVASKPTHVATKTVRTKSSKVAVDRSVLLFLVLTLVLAGIMLIVQAQSSNTLSEQNKAQQALENESATMLYEDMKDDKKANP